MNRTRQMNWDIVQETDQEEHHMTDGDSLGPI